jgi:hypothetical protein
MQGGYSTKGTEMKKKLLTLGLLGAFLLPGTSALATTFTFMSTDGAGTKSDMMDLDHGFYYGWSIVNANASALGAELRSGRAVIQSATLQFKNIYNWTYEANDALNSFLLSAPPPVPGLSQSVPVVINGVPQGHNLYTYQKTTVSTKTNTTGVVPDGYVLKGSVYNPTKKTTTYTYEKTTVSVKTNITGVPPSGFFKVSEKFIPDMVTLGNGVPLSSDLWQRSDQESRTDVDWGVEAYRIQDINNDPLNPWHDVTGGVKKTWNLTYQFDEGSINSLFEYALDGSFGIGLDPDCHYYNDGIVLTIVTAPVPEPETYAMMLAGLGLIGLAARRRKQKAAAAA